MCIRDRAYLTHALHLPHKLHIACPLLYIFVASYASYRKIIFKVSSISFNFSSTSPCFTAVSYTHLDVYKRQPLICPFMKNIRFLFFFLLMSLIFFILEINSKKKYRKHKYKQARTPPYRRKHP